MTIITTFSYNALLTCKSQHSVGEPSRIQTSDGLLQEDFTYDGLGRIETLTRVDSNGSRVYEYTYDLLGQITEVNGGKIEIGPGDAKSASALDFMLFSYFNYQFVDDVFAWRTLVL